MRFFNTAGPVKAPDHYHIPPLDRLDLDEVRTLIEQKKYFVLYAPRQTGKTSALLALRDLLNAGSDYRCVYVNVEPAQALREDVEQATQVILGELASRVRLTLGDEFLTQTWAAIFAEFGPGALREELTRWAEVQAFLQRIVNSGGRIEREYGLGRGRTDLLMVWPQGEQTRKIVVECKILHKSLEQTVAEGVEQTVGYMDRCGAEAGHLVIFDRRANRRWADKVFRDQRTSVGGAAIEVWGM